MIIVQVLLNLQVLIWITSLSVVYSINLTSTTSYIQRGGGFELACQVAGLGVHLWYKDGKPIVPNSINKFHLESDNPSYVAEKSDYYTTMRLIVKEADSIHTGEYKCNNAGLYSQRIVVVTGKEDIYLINCSSLMCIVMRN